MTFRQLFDPESSTYTYLLADDETKEAILIDPVIEQVDRDLKVINELGLRLKYIFETHVHADHITGASKLRERTGAKTVLGEYAGVDCADILLRDGEELKFGRHKIKALFTPGHTDACTSYSTESMVFTGDTLLIRGTGRTDFQSGDAGRMYESIKEKIFSLPDETLIYPGHDYKGWTVSSVREEKAFNPRINTKVTREQFIDTMNNLNLPLPKKIHESVPANQACGNKAEH